MAMSYIEMLQLKLNIISHPLTSSGGDKVQDGGHVQRVPAGVPAAPAADVAVRGGGDENHRPGDPSHAHRSPRQHTQTQTCTVSS